VNTTFSPKDRRQGWPPSMLAEMVVEASWVTTSP
jgi:hypothetical protein